MAGPTNWLNFLMDARGVTYENFNFLIPKSCQPGSGHHYCFKSLK